VAAEPEPSNVQPLHPIRVVVAGDDARFLSVAGFLLARNRFVVETTRRLDKLLDVVERHRPSVVVVDATGSLVVAANAVGSLSARFPSVAILVVSEQAKVPSTLPVLPKWDALPRIGQEVERLFRNHDDEDALRA
jgi:DNA-binding NtrC family response regulator